MEVGWGTSLRLAGRTHTRFCTGITCAVQFKWGCWRPQTLSRGCTFRSQICCRYVLNSSTYLFGRMMVVMMTTTCGCFTDNNYRPQLGSMMTPGGKCIRKKNLCFFLLDMRWKYWFGWQELQSKIHSTPKIYSTPPTYLIYVSYILRLLRLIWQKNFIWKYEGLCERKLMFLKLATPEIQVPIRLIDAHWSGNKKKFN